MSAVGRIRAWLNAKHELPWAADELSRLRLEVKASLRRNRRQRRAGRRRLPKADPS